MGQTDSVIASTEPNPNESTIAGHPWQSFIITRSIRQPHVNEHDFKLLKNHKSSIFGDICFRIGDEEYILDRTILASKSNNFSDLVSPDRKMTTDDINTLVDLQCIDSRFRYIVEIIYGKNMRSVLTEDNFMHLLNDINQMELETDLETFREFIEKIIESKAQQNDRMFEIFNFISHTSPKFNYLLPTISQYFSDRLLEVHRENEILLNLSTEEFIFVLLHKSDNLLEKQSIARVCAEWICHDCQNRIKTLKNLVNATKYRYGLQPYCDSDPNEFLRRFHSSDELNIQQVERYFNELLSHFGEVKFDLPAELNEKLDIMKSGARIVFPNDRATKWMSYLENELFCDVAIDVQGTIFKLHRIKLSSVSGYFYDLFTNPTESLAFEIDNADAKNELKMSQHTLDDIDPVTFKSIVEYIYKEEIQITSANHLINVLNGSKFLKMDDLFKNCNSKLLKTVPDLSTGIFMIFQHVYENEKKSPLYTAILKRIIDLRPKLDKIPDFLNISLDILKEIVESPALTIENPDEMLDLCSKWIFHDIQNRFECIIEVARAINRNFTMNNNQLELETPENGIDYSQQHVKQQLIRILSTTSLVPAKTINVQSDEQKPCFLSLNHNDSLCVLDANFNEIIQLPGVCKNNTPGSEFVSSATLIDNQLFILFWEKGYSFKFQLYDFSSNKMIFLASDARMDYDDFVILNCNDDVYYFSDKIALQYSVKLNRWIRFLKNDEGNAKQYTSDGKKLYKIYCIPNDDETDNWIYKASYYDFEQNSWIVLPDIPDQTKSCKIMRVNIINNELSVTFKSKTFSFNWITQTWCNISNFNLNEDVWEVVERTQDILYVTKKNKVYTYSTVRNELSLERKLKVIGQVLAIHKVGKQNILAD